MGSCESNSVALDYALENGSNHEHKWVLIHEERDGPKSTLGYINKRY